MRNKVMGDLGNLLLGEDMYGWWKFIEKSVVVAGIKGTRVVYATTYSKKNIVLCCFALISFINFR